MTNESPAVQENKMGVLPIRKLLFSMAIPMMISMLVQALYNIVDSIFVARIDENALTAVSLAFPMQNLMIAFGVGFGVGLNALLSRYLGMKKREMAEKVAMQGILLAIATYVMFLIIGLFGIELFMRTQVDVPEIIDYGVTYLRICTVFSFGIFVQIIFERLLQSTGRTVQTMLIQLIGAVINIILDPILIFGLLGFPEMGIAGAAWATVIGQIIGGICGVVINHRRNHDISLDWHYFRPDWPIIKRIAAISIPSILMAAISSVMTFIMNIILVGFTETAAAVFGVYFKLQSFIFMPIFGLNNGMVPIVAYNYGAKQPDRVLKTIKLSAAAAICIMFVGLTVFHVLPSQLFTLFDASESMLEIGIPALRIISLSFVFAGFCIIGSSSCQALGYSMYSLFISLIRQLVVLVPAAFLLSLTGVLRNVWLAWPIAEVITVAVVVLFLRKVLHKTGLIGGGAVIIEDDPD